MAEGVSIDATAGQVHYLATVMRRGVGDQLRVFNGRDGEFAARINSIRRSHANFLVEHLVRPQGAEPDVWLAFALLKRDATDFVVQKATELGVSALLPIVTERTNSHRMNSERLVAIAIEAAEQSERLTVPKLQSLQTLPELLAKWPRNRRLLTAVERAAAAPIEPARGPVGLLVGPEGGFTSAELEAMRLHSFVTDVSLGPRILRAETACIAGLALLQAGDRG